MILPGQPRKGNYSFLCPTSTYYPVCVRRGHICVDGYIFVRGVGVEFTHTERLLMTNNKKEKNSDLEAETGKDPKKPDMRRVAESFFNLPNEYSSSIILTDSDFILTNRTCAIAITADMSFRTALAADFKREY